MLLLILLKYRQTSAVPVKNEFYYFAKLGFFFLSKNLIIEGRASAQKSKNVKLRKGTFTRLRIGVGLCDMCPPDNLRDLSHIFGISP